MGIVRDAVNMQTCLKLPLCAKMLLCVPCAADFNNDKSVDVGDVLELLASYGSRCMVTGVLAGRSIDSVCMMRTRCIAVRDVRSHRPASWLSKSPGCEKGSMACAADVDKNGIVNVRDLLHVL